MQHLDFCRQILELSDPWQVDSIKIDQPSRRLDIYIGFGVSKKSRFGLAPLNDFFRGAGQRTCSHCSTPLPATGVFATVCLRHLPIAGMRTFLHVPSPGTVRSSHPNCFCMRKWAASDTEFTEAMRDYVLGVLRTVPNSNTAAQLTGISHREVQQICEASGFTPARPEQAPGCDIGVKTAAARSGLPIRDIAIVPDENHPGWTRLISGKLTIEADSIALRMLLQRMHADLEEKTDRESQLAWTRTLRTFFLKNQQLLRREIEQLNDNAVALVAAAEVEQDSMVPDVDERVWQELINGDLSLPEGSVSSKMLLARIRHGITRDPSEANRREGAAALRQYFLKNRQRLVTEISFLNGEKTRVQHELPESGDQDSAVPSIAHPCWQRLIDGDIHLVADTLALKMLLGQIRRSLDKNQSASSMLACTKLLRHYFLKHRNLHQKDLETLKA